MKKYVKYVKYYASQKNGKIHLNMKKTVAFYVRRVYDKAIKKRRCHKMLIPSLSCLMTSSILSFFPKCKVDFRRIIQFLIISIIGFIYLFVLRKDKLWLCLLAGMKILILNMYEFSCALLESDEERRQEHSRRRELYYESCLIDFLLLLGICA